MEQAKIWQVIAEKLMANKELLNDLDQAIGDGDHGTNLTRGFSEVIKDPTKLNGTWQTSFNFVAMTLMSKVGGSSGPLFGIFFLNMSKTIKTGTTQQEWLDAYLAGIKAVKTLGKSDVGEGTMLDALAPAIKVLETNLNLSNKDVYPKMALAAQEGAEGTIATLKTKGRASYLKERSVNHMDPGAKSVSLIFEAVSEALQ
ncbi:dihydroxyacetone kinase subunit DhaL [Spiroplasma chrysopicola]|uniref:Dihydroxyacetone kinase DhaL subunit n=1 Tax=Spiroplasma chrysopicola DF-1 TaxID=1276227 RepID=R4UBX6_9MOLU|nr:dihydroxyacetone kinase subunit DhaL [Spiroplasma chrysopicola]AGM25424.1 dihydroxyacetone kinase DhaL subunit [Spiroplasma chrysopicola DF-1]